MAAVETPPWAKAFGRGWSKVPAVWRDLIIAGAVILTLLLGLWIYTGQPLGDAPLVVVESGSMMHPDTPYGRIGTIDPGDLILVKDGERADVVTLYGSRAGGGGETGAGDREGYGLGGDVVIYRQDQCGKGQETPIIHRAITWVDVRQRGGQAVFSYHDSAGVWQRDRPDVHLPEVGISHNSAFPVSGWVTKGDNPGTNSAADQNDICSNRLIQEDWLVGKARGEIPWVGLLKFMVQGNHWQPSPSDDLCVRTVGRAVAPCDSFTMLWIVLGVIVLVPLAWDGVMRLRRTKEVREGARLEPPTAPPTEVAPAPPMTPPVARPPMRPQPRPPPPRDDMGRKPPAQP